MQNIQNPFIQEDSWFPQTTDGNITICILTISWIDPDTRELVKIPQEDLDRWCDELKNELRLDYLDWGYIAGRCALSVNKNSLNKLYQILQGFLDRGISLMMNDSTQVTFKAGEAVSADLHARRIQLEAARDKYYQSMN